MPHWKCQECSHEWDGSVNECRCDWCGDLGIVIEPKTPLERLDDDLHDGLVPDDPWWEEFA